MVSDSFRSFWRALDGLFADVHPTPWGAVVTDGRFPSVWDANYARVEAASPGPVAAEVERALVPELRRVGSSTVHVVSLDPASTTRLLSELSTRGHRLEWEVVMETGSSTAGDSRVAVEEVPPGPELWDAVRETLGLFGTSRAAPDVVDQLQRIERDVLAPGGKRWFGARGEDGRLASIAALMVLDGVAYVDNVATLPHARGRGLASAVTSHLVREALTAGAITTCLLADPDRPEVIRLYEGLGFRESGRIASTRGPLPPAEP